MKDRKYIKGIVFFETKVITLVIIFIFVLFYFIMSYNIKKSAISDNEEIKNHLYSRYAYDVFITNDRCMGIKSVNDITKLKETKLDLMSMYQNEQLPCFIGDRNNYKVEVENLDIAYRYIPKIVSLGNVIFLLDYSLTAQSPIDDEDDATIEDEMIKNMKDITTTIDEILHELKKQHPEIDFEMNVEIDAFSDMYENKIDKIYPYSKFDKEKILNALEEYHKQVIPQKGSPLVSPILEVTKGIKNATLVIISDMKFDQFPDDETLKKLKDKNISIYAIVLTSSRTKPYYVKIAIKDRYDKITYCDAYIDPQKGEYKLGYNYDFSYRYDYKKNIYYPKIYNVRCINPNEINSDENVPGTYKKIGTLKQKPEFYYSETKRMTDATNGRLIEVKNRDQLKNAFIEIYRKLESDIKDKIKDAVKIREVKVKHRKWRFGVYENTPSSLGGKSITFAMPVVIEKENGLNELGILKFTSYHGEFEYLYSMISYLCNSKETITMRKDLMLPMDVTINKDNICLKNKICKKLRCEKTLKIPQTINKNSLIEFESTPNSLEVKVLG